MTAERIGLLEGLLARARGHVKATVDRTNTRLAYEEATVLLAEIDAALGEMAEEERIAW